MDCLLQNWPEPAWRGRTVLGGRGAAIVAILGLLGSLALTGCSQSPAGLVPVSGKLTLDGGAWPKKGQITFSVIKPAPGHPSLPQAARIEDDGSFTIKTAIAPGLVPGEYGVVITCSKDATDGGRAGKSAVAARYGSAMTSGLKVMVAEGSKPIFLDWDIKSK